MVFQEMQRGIGEPDARCGMLMGSDAQVVASDSKTSKKPTCASPTHNTHMLQFSRIIRVRRRGLGEWFEGERGTHVKPFSAPGGVRDSGDYTT